MSCPHYDIRIVKRSKGQSAVASAAYQSGEKLYSEYELAVKNYSLKEEVVHTEILLPDNAPRESFDREILWNAAERAEKQWNAQLARRIVLAIPREVPKEQHAALVRDYCNEHFVKNGMCCDFAIHDKNDDNPHAHILLTMRAIDENGKWLPKSRKVYDLDKNGERIRLKSGRWKSHKENTVDWNDRGNAEKWRSGWADMANRYLEANGRKERLDLRSYRRQGIEKAPTVHMGAAATNLERKGVRTGVGELNRQIRAANNEWKRLATEISEMRAWLDDLQKQYGELERETGKTQHPVQTIEADPLVRSIATFFRLERPMDNSGAFEPDESDFEAARIYLSEHNIGTFDDMAKQARRLEDRVDTAVDRIDKRKQRIRIIDGIFRAASDYQKTEPVCQQYQSIRWKNAKAKFHEENRRTFEQRDKAIRFIKANNGSLKVNAAKLKTERGKLAKEIAALNRSFDRARADADRLKQIRNSIEPVMTEMQIKEQRRLARTQPQKKHRTEPSL